MRGEVRAIVANDIADWPNWEAVHPADELQWFTVSVGPPDEVGADNFQAAVATPQGLKERRTKTPFVGIVVPVFTPHIVEDAIRAFVARVERNTWQGVAEQLEPKMSWEFMYYCQ